jgi:hypothetical protein
VKQPPKAHLYQTLQNNQQMNKIGGGFNVDQKHQEAKDAMRGLLEIINAQYVA